MQEITPSFIYWITRLNGINFFLGTILTFATIAFIIFIVFLILSRLSGDDEEKSTFHFCFVISTAIFLLSAILFVFTPTTKEACAMYVVPKIVNNEKVQNIGQEFYDLALDWMKELHPKTVRKGNKDNVQSVQKEKE